MRMPKTKLINVRGGSPLAANVVPGLGITRPTTYFFFWSLRVCISDEKYAVSPVHEATCMHVGILYNINIQLSIQRHEL